MEVSFLRGWLGLLALVSAALPVPAAGVVLCTSGFPCNPGGFDPPSEIVPPLPTPVGQPSLQILGLRLAAGEEGLSFNAPGDLILHVPSGHLEALDIDLRAVGEVRVLDAITLDAGNSVSLCALGICDPFEGDLVPIQIVGDPFHIGIDGPLLGTLALFAAGHLDVTTDPFPSVPEPNSAALLALGLAMLRNRRARPRSR